MNEDTPDRDTPKVKHAKAVAHEAVGKLIGDDAAIRKGQKKQGAAKAAARNKQEKE